MEAPNECIFRFLCIESVACGAGAKIQLQCGGSAMALAQDFSFGPVSARAPLHARPWSEKPRQACTLLPILETALELHWIPAHRIQNRSTGHVCPFQKQVRRNVNRVRSSRNVFCRRPCSAVCRRNESRDSLARWWTCNS